MQVGDLVRVLTKRDLIGVILGVDKICPDGDCWYTMLTFTENEYKLVGSWAIEKVQCK